MCPEVAAEGAEVAVEVVVRASLEDRPVGVEDDPADDMEDGSFSGCGVDSQLPVERSRAGDENGCHREAGRIRQRSPGEWVAQRTGGADVIDGADRGRGGVVEGRRPAQLP